MMYAPIGSASYRLHVPKDAMEALIADHPCTLLHAARHPSGRKNEAIHATIRPDCCSYKSNAQLLNVTLS